MQKAQFSAALMHFSVACGSGEKNFRGQKSDISGLTESGGKGIHLSASFFANLAATIISRREIPQSNATFLGVPPYLMHPSSGGGIRTAAAAAGQADRQAGSRQAHLAHFPKCRRRC